MAHVLEARQRPDGPTWVLLVASLQDRLDKSCSGWDGDAAWRHWVTFRT